ncbi:hypothetical protein [Rhodococcus sp. 852002-51564_SCH6189132-a]|uniref:hypothetical protein n=1 Tax=Rhodococcus sp. 852002-51564_SCH6189132-a TaxID=1834103 RepID=UPI0012E74B5A|nr:hypothetical protein [Rhodococcus sp. 852002-51564_SCH6189132-a]
MAKYPPALVSAIEKEIEAFLNRSGTALESVEVSTFFEMFTGMEPTTLAGYEFQRRRDEQSAAKFKNPKNALVAIGDAVDAIRSRTHRLAQKYGEEGRLTNPTEGFRHESDERANFTPGRRPGSDKIAHIVARMEDRTFLALASGDSEIFRSHMSRSASIKQKLLQEADEKYHFSFRIPFELTRQLLKFSIDDPAAARAKMMSQVDRIESRDFDVLLRTPAGKRANPNARTEEYDILDFEILPPGTSLRDLAEYIARHKTSISTAQIDHRRIDILEDLRHHFGWDNCHFARGRRSSNASRSGSGSNVDEDYIVLVRRHPPSNWATNEDAIAISQFANKNATFFVRHDVSQQTWRDVFAQTKHDAREMHARRLVFKNGRDGISAYDAMRMKLIALAECSRYSFHRAPHYDPNRGKHVM